MSGVRHRLAILLPSDDAGSSFSVSASFHPCASFSPLFLCSTVPQTFPGSLLRLNNDDMPKDRRVKMDKLLSNGMLPACGQ